jgi:hypothetical protein
MIELETADTERQALYNEAGQLPDNAEIKVTAEFVRRLMRDFTRMEAASNGAAGRIDHAIDVLSGR